MKLLDGIVKLTVSSATQSLDSERSLPSSLSNRKQEILPAMTPNFGAPPVLESGSLVLVTGANGYIGSHVADQLIQAGYRVRGTARDASKVAWLKEMFDQKYGPGKFESVVVEDMAKAGAYDEACKGVYHSYTLPSHTLWVYYVEAAILHNLRLLLVSSGPSAGSAVRHTLSVFLLGDKTSLAD